MTTNTEFETVCYWCSSRPATTVLAQESACAHCVQAHRANADVQAMVQTYRRGVLAPTACEACGAPDPAPCGGLMLCDSCDTEWTTVRSVARQETAVAS